jgi:hypothetical protein
MKNKGYTVGMDRWFTSSTHRLWTLNTWDSNAKEKINAKGNIFQKAEEGRKTVHAKKSSTLNPMV